MSPIGRMLCKLADKNAALGWEDFRKVACDCNLSMWRVCNAAINLGFLVRGTF